MKHLTEAQVEEYIAGGETIPEVRDHLQSCRDCFRLYMDVVELAYDAGRPLDVGTRSRIADVVRIAKGESHSFRDSREEIPGPTRMRGKWMTYAAAVALLGLGIGFGVGQSGVFSLEEDYRMTASVGQCEILERRRGFSGQPERMLKSGPFSVCEFSFREEYRLRLFEGELSIPEEPIGSFYELNAGILVVDRTGAKPLSVRLGSLDVRFQGTKAVLNRKEATVQVTHGAVEVSGPDLKRPLRVSVGQQLESGVVSIIKPGEAQALERLFQELPAEASEAELREILPRMYPRQNYLRQRLFLHDGRVLEGLVILEDGVFTVITGKDSFQVRKSEVRRVRILQ